MTPEQKKILDDLKLKATMAAPAPDQLAGMKQPFPWGSLPGEVKPNIAPTTASGGQPPPGAPPPVNIATPPPIAPNLVPAQPASNFDVVAKQFGMPAPLAPPNGNAVAQQPAAPAPPPKQQVAADVTNSPQATYDKAKAESTTRRAGSLDSDSWRNFFGGMAVTNKPTSYSGATAARSVAGAQAEEQGLQANRRIAEQMGVTRDVGMAQADAQKEKAKAPLAVAQEHSAAARDVAATNAKGRETTAKAAGDARLAGIDKVAEYKKAIAQQSNDTKLDVSEAHNQTLRDLSGNMTAKEMARLTAAEKSHALNAWQKQLMLLSVTDASKVDKTKLKEAQDMVDKLLPRGQTAGTVPSALAAQTPGQPAAPIERIHDGKIALFDPNTKAFLGYK